VVDRGWVFGSEVCCQTFTSMDDHVPRVAEFMRLNQFVGNVHTLLGLASLMVSDVSLLSNTQDDDRKPWYFPRSLVAEVTTMLGARMRLYNISILSMSTLNALMKHPSINRVPLEALAGSNCNQALSVLRSRVRITYRSRLRSSLCVRW